MAVAVMPAMGPTLGSAAGLISMLEEEQVQLQTSALRSLNAVVDTHWAEVAGSISVIEALHEDEFFASRDLAALLASKVRLPLDLLPPRARARSINASEQILAAARGRASRKPVATARDPQIRNDLN